MFMFDPNVIVIDNFAGGGGASSGLKRAMGRDPDVALNHDEWACAMYRANHKDSLVYCQSVYQADPREVQMAASRRRGSDKPLPVGLCWFSPDCTDHSKAKGSAPIRTHASRDLAWVVVHWARLVRPTIIMMENVEEWLGWGPVRQRRWPAAGGKAKDLFGVSGAEQPGEPMFDLQGNPVLERDPNRSGETFRKWLRELKACGYKVEYRILRSCDFGSPTIRKRLYLIARCDGQPIVWPAQSHAEPDNDLGLPSHRTTAECVDFQIHCPSIFERKRDLVDNTQRRIAVGIEKFVLENATPFIIPVTHQGDARVHSILEPLRTITTAKRGELALVSPTLIQTSYGERKGQALRALNIHKPLGTIVAGGAKHALIAAFLAQHNTGVIGRPADQPLSTIVHRGTQQQLVTADLMPAPANGNNHYTKVVSLLDTFGRSGRSPEILIGNSLYRIVDIGMRMLTPRELFTCQGFSPDYEIETGIDAYGEAIAINKTMQIEKCGNSVSPDMSEALARANIPMSFMRAAA